MPIFPEFDLMATVTARLFCGFRLRIGLLSLLDDFL